jgi:hypothetical protein
MSVEERFFKYVIPDGDCWRWVGYTTPAGYGQFGIDYKLDYAHRISYILHKGDIPDGLEVCHLCIKHRWCVNPDHLIVDTHGANMDMREQQGTLAKGSKCGRSKLTEQQVHEIKQKATTMSSRQIAKEYNVNKSTILSIINRKIWNHI